MLKMGAPSFHTISSSRKSTTCRQICITIFTCYLLLVIAGIFIRHKGFSNNQSSSQSIRKPTCPIPDNIKPCIHHSSNLTTLMEICPNMPQPVVDCRDHQRDLIVTDMKFIGIFHNLTNIMIVTGSDIGEELDRFVQKDSRWIIDVMGGKGYEILRSPIDVERLRLQRNLDQVQNRCVNFFNGARGIAGFGSSWHNVGLALAFSQTYNMTLYPNSEYSNFIRTTTCTETDLVKAFIESPPETDYSIWNASTINFKTVEFDLMQLMQKNKEVIRPEFQHKGLFWWKSMLTYYAIRPNFKLRESIRQSSVVSTPCISIHVRHSDKGGEAELLSFSKYMEAASQYKSRTGVSNIYLMTDDPAVISSSKSLWYRGFKFHYMDLPRTNKGWTTDVENGLALDVQEKNFLIDIYSAAQCEHSIVTYSSNVGRLIAEIAYATRNTEPDVVSLDEPWMMYP